MSKSNQRKTRTYTNEFKQSAVQLALRSPSIKVAAKELGVPEPTLNRWVYLFKDGKLSGLRLILHMERLKTVLLVLIK